MLMVTFTPLAAVDADGSNGAVSALEAGAAVLNVYPSGGKRMRRAGTPAKFQRKGQSTAGKIET
jgi:hypothetical protein